MSAEEKTMNESLSQTVAGLFVRSKEGEELSSRIQRLRSEILKVTEREDAVFGRFRGLLESFREIIPDEKQRYHAAIKALSTTAKISQQEIVQAVGDQLEELKVLEKGLMPAIPAWRDELKTLEAKSKQLRDELARLRERMERLEKEEDEVIDSMATREKDVEIVEKAVKQLFTDIGTEITQIRNKIGEFTAERPAAQPAPQKEPAKKEAPAEKKAAPEKKKEAAGEKKKAAEPKHEIRGAAAEEETEWQKKCPMCGGRMNYHADEHMWMCYSCAHEEPVMDEPEDVDDDDDDEAEDADDAASAGQPSSRSKTCPACRKKMYWYPKEKAWRCPTCQYERRI